MSIATTRNCVNAIIDGSIKDATYSTDPTFGWELPETVPGVDSAVLSPRNTWPDASEYDLAEKKLANMYFENFKKYAGKSDVDYTQYGPKV